MKHTNHGTFRKMKKKTKFFMNTEKQVALLSLLKEKLSSKDVWTKGQVKHLIDKIVIEYLLEEKTERTVRF